MVVPGVAVRSGRAGPYVTLGGSTRPRGFLASPRPFAIAHLRPYAGCPMSPPVRSVPMRIGLRAVAPLALATSTAVAADPPIVFQTQPLGRVLDEVRAGADIL